jgi:hypothetical protein
MARKRKSRPARTDLAKDLWVNPHSKMMGPHANVNIGSAGLLELADVALRLKKPAVKKKKPVAAVRIAKIAATRQHPA